MNLPHPKQLHEARVMVVEDEIRLRELLHRGCPVGDSKQRPPEAAKKRFACTMPIRSTS